MEEMRGQSCAAFGEQTNIQRLLGEKKKLMKYAWLQSCKLYCNMEWELPEQEPPFCLCTKYWGQAVKQIRVGFLRDLANPAGPARSCNLGSRTVCHIVRSREGDGLWLHCTYIWAANRTDDASQREGNCRHKAAGFAPGFIRLPSRDTEHTATRISIYIHMIKTDRNAHLWCQVTTFSYAQKFSCHFKAFVAVHISSLWSCTPTLQRPPPETAATTRTYQWPGK